MLIAVDVVLIMSNETSDRLPIGTKVRYHGSIDYMHGEYVITGYGADYLMEAQRTKLGDDFERYYPDGVAYTLMPEGVEYNYRNRDEALYAVRPASISLVK